MQNFEFAPNSFNPRESQKKYVFVDEHNRHKRVKVTRACEECRRKKVKCDAATTDVWPCSACMRLKLRCNPPLSIPNQEQNTPQSVQIDGGGTCNNDGGVIDQASNSMQTLLAEPFQTGHPIYSQPGTCPDLLRTYHNVSHDDLSSINDHHSMQYPNLHASIAADERIQQQNPTRTVFPNLSIFQHAGVHRPERGEQDGYGQENLVKLLGTLRVDETGTAGYLDRKNSSKMLCEEPAFEEADHFKDILPPILSGPDLKVRIPPELMPDDETIMQYFDIYFSNVHPYVPVLNKAAFYQQWHTNRESISPLILEALFAIAGRLADEPAQGHQWLALASKHADSFMDKPRLSTLQGMLIILKARESAPKRGYYFRSWMTVVACVEMAKDLGLNDHYEDHVAGRSCGSSLADCITKTRIWQTIFICELMIGSPQGRTDLAVNPTSLDLRIQNPTPGLDDAEYSITRNFTYLARIVSKVRGMLDIYARVRRKKEWGIDPEVVEHTPALEHWMNEIPPDLQIRFAPDGSPPWIPTHFIGNLHSYYYLSVIMLHRPQLTFMEPLGVDGGWKRHMMMCYSSAKYLCRLQEGLLQCFGMTGLLCMQRGINFTIYCILTCTILHLVSLTSPDPDLNSDAPEYFTRHMRMLEQCSSRWPMPEMQQQIDALREAFSADTRKSFVLKPSFKFRGPPIPLSSVPCPNTQYHSHNNLEQPRINSYSSYSTSPLVSAGTTESESLVMLNSSQRNPPQQQMPTGVSKDGGGWNPSKIFDQWSSTFGTPPPSMTTDHATPLGSSTHSGAQEALPIPDAQILQGMNRTAQQPMPPQKYSGTTISAFISPSMWRDSVTSVYEGGMKRGWDFGDHEYGMAKRVR